MTYQHKLTQQIAQTTDFDIFISQITKNTRSPKYIFKGSKIITFLINNELDTKFTRKQNCYEFNIRILYNDTKTKCKEYIYIYPKMKEVERLHDLQIAPLG